MQSAGIGREAGLSFLAWAEVLFPATTPEGSREGAGSAVPL